MSQIEQLVNFMITNGVSWVSSQRDAHRPRARALTPDERAALNTFFSAETLDGAKVDFVPFIQNPEFFSAFDAPPVDFGKMDGITFVDTIVISEMRDRAEGRWLPLLFHELVHVVQYKILGLEEFMRRYVRGWAENGREYLQIPLEKQAYRFQHEFEFAPEIPVDIEHKVREELGVDAT